MYPGRSWKSRTRCRQALVAACTLLDRLYEGESRTSAAAFRLKPEATHSAPRPHPLRRVASAFRRKARALTSGKRAETMGLMIRGLIVASLVLAVQAAAPTQGVTVLRVKVVLTDAAGTATPVPRHV